MTGVPPRSREKWHRSDSHQPRGVLVTAPLPYREIAHITIKNLDETECIIHVSFAAKRKELRNTMESRREEF